MQLVPEFHLHIPPPPPPDMDSWQQLDIRDSRLSWHTRQPLRSGRKRWEADSYGCARRNMARHLSRHWRIRYYIFGAKSWFRATDKVPFCIFMMSISSSNPMFDHLLELSHQDDSNKWSNRIWSRNKGVSVDWNLFFASYLALWLLL